MTRKPKVVDVCIYTNSFHRMVSMDVLKKFPDSKSNFVRMSKTRKEIIAKELLHVALDANHTDKFNFSIKYMDDNNKVCSLVWWVEDLTHPVYTKNVKGKLFKVCMQLKVLEDFGDHGNWADKSFAEVTIEFDPYAPGCSK